MGDVNISFDLSCKLSSTAGSVSKGYALVEDSGGRFVVATTANLAGGRQPRCLSTSDSSQDSVVPIQTVGPIPTSVTGLTAGAEAQATVNSLGRIVRLTGQPTSSTVLVGRVAQDGTFWANFNGAASASTSASVALVGDSDQAGGGTSNSAAMQAAIDAATSVIGATYDLPAGFFRLSESVGSLPGIAFQTNKRIKFRSVGTGQYGQGTTFVCDAGVTGTQIAYASGQDAIFENVTFMAASQLTDTTAASWNGLTATVTLASVGTWRNGQIVRLQGAAGLLPLPTSAIYCSTTNTSNVVTLGGTAAIGNRGFVIGQYLVIGAAFPQRTRITAINLSAGVAVSLTMARPAVATLAMGTRISLAADVVGQIRSGAATATTAGTTTLVLDNVGTAADGASVPTYPFTGSPTTTDLVLEHADCGAYVNAIAHFDYCTFGIAGKGFKGSGLEFRGATSDTGGAQNCDFASATNCWFFENLHACRMADGDANGVVLTNCKSVRSRSYAFVDWSALGTLMVNCHTDADYGFLTGPSPVNATTLLRPYVESGSISFLGDGTSVFGGTMPNYFGGYSSIGGVINRCTIGDATSASKFTDYEMRFASLNSYLYSFTSRLGGTAEYQFVKTSVAQDGVAGWWGLRHQSGTAPYAYLMPDTDSAQWVATTARIWLPDGYHWGGHAGSLSDANLPVHDIGTDPSALAGVVGSHRQNRTPAIGQPKGWYCTVTGGAGAATWVSEGNLV